MIKQAAEIQDKPALSSEEWDDLRTNLVGTIMAETSLHGLAQNAGMKWFIRGKKETPARYLEYSLEELADLPEFYGKGNRLSNFFSILQETIAFDDPFSVMVDKFESHPSDAMLARSVLQEMEVPFDYPVDLMQFSKRTRDLCLEGEHDTLDKLISFLNESTTAVIMNEEFRQFLSCVKSRDKNGLAQFIPIRQGCKGIYLAEALGLFARQLNDHYAATLLYAFKIESNKPEWAEDIVLQKDRAQRLIEDVKMTATKYFDMMPGQASDLRSCLASGIGSSVRFFISLNNPHVEELALAIAMAAVDQKPRFKGLMGRFLNKNN